MTRQNQRQDTRSDMSVGLITGVLLVLVLGACQTHASEVDSQSTAPNAHGRDNGDAGEQLDRVGNALDEAERVLGALRKKATSLVGKIKELEDPALHEKLSKLMDEQKSLQGKYETLSGQVAELRRALDSRRSDPSTLSLAELKQAIDKATKDKEALKAKLAGIQNPSDPNSKGCPVYEKFLGSKRKRYVLIYRGHVAPIEPPYYEFRDVSIGNLFVGKQEAKRVKEGDPVAQAVESGGCLDTLRRNLDTDREYVVLDVCTDSITAFRAVVEYLRKHKVPYTWEPEEDKVFTFSPWGSSPEWGEGAGR